MVGFCPKLKPSGSSAPHFTSSSAPVCYRTLVALLCRPFPEGNHMVGRAKNPAHAAPVSPSHRHHKGRISWIVNLSPWPATKNRRISENHWEAGRICPGRGVSRMGETFHSGLPGIFGLRFLAKRRRDRSRPAWTTRSVQKLEKEIAMGDFRRYHSGRCQVEHGGLQWGGTGCPVSADGCVPLFYLRHPPAVPRVEG
jgi:hypothetical protein